MKSNYSRRNFINYSAGTACGLFGIPQIFHQSFQFLSMRDDFSLMTESLPDGFPRQDLASVKETVGVSHGRFERVKELVIARPALAKAVWDWGFGDWESALGAASHVGRPDIANFLIDHGARPNLFTYAMLGKLDSVRSMIEARPGVQQISGPHGITLLQHAQNRLPWKENTEEDLKQVQEVIKYLESLGDADVKSTSLEISEEEKAVYLGQYQFGENPEDVFNIDLHRRGWLTIRRADQVSRVLNRIEKHGFTPSGVPSVKVRFDVKEGKATSLTIFDPGPVVKAIRSNS